MRRQAIIVGALGTVQLLSWGSTYYLPAILADPIGRDLGVTDTMVFVAFSAALLTMAILGPMVGRQIDRHGGRSALASSNLVLSFGLALLGFAQDAATLFAAWIVIGSGMALGLYEAVFSTLASAYGKQARGAIIGITLVGGLASTAFWPASAWIETQFGWRTVCFAWAAAHLAIGLPLNFLFAPAPAGSLEPSLPKTATGPSLAPPSSEPKYAVPLLAFIFAATWFTSTALAAHLPRLLQEVGATPAAAVAAAALIGPAQVMGRLAEFGFLRKLHPLSSARLAALAHPVGAALLWIGGAPLAIIFSLFHGAGNGILTIANDVLPLSIFGPENYGRRQGLLMMPARFAQAAAPFLFALVIGWLGAGALLVTAGLGVAALAALLLLSSPKKA
ncbi:MAG: hypothetical protein ABS35_35020 [Kaistia sp. SCN 65-12]|nr:MAG: hypothetical protein ABS35_35020 [Kaistia sp. SCN 65-12]